MKKPLLKPDWGATKLYKTRIFKYTVKLNLINKNTEKEFIYIGCQILNKDLFRNHKVINFSIKDLWDERLKKGELNGFESLNKFYHLTDLETFKKLKDL